MMEASRINLLGLRSSRTVSLYLESAIDRFYPHVRQLSNESEFLYDKIFRLSAEEDIIIIFRPGPVPNGQLTYLPSAAIARANHSSYKHVPESDCPLCRYCYRYKLCQQRLRYSSAYVYSRGPHCRTGPPARPRFHENT